MTDRPSGTDPAASFTSRVSEVPDDIAVAVMIEGHSGVSWSDWLQIARVCEEAAVPALFVSDHYQGFAGSHSDPIAVPDGSLESWGVICALAAVTSSVRLGTLASPVTFRHPSVLAKLVATADVI